MYSPHSTVMDALYIILNQWEKSPIPSVRNAALERAYKQIVFEDENTAYQCLGPVNKMTNQVARYIVEGRDSFAYEQHKVQRQKFMWLAKEGMMMRGTNGSQLWDLSFITQAMVESGLAEEEGNREALLKALGWLDRCQIRENPKHYESAYRHQTKGAWPFSTKEQGYTVSDCTAEGLKAVLYIQEHLRYVRTSTPCTQAGLNPVYSYAPKLVSEERLCEAVDVLLSMQNPGGGFASYELIRAPHIIEKLNPAEVFGKTLSPAPRSGGTQRIH